MDSQSCRGQLHVDAHSAVVTSNDLLDAVDFNEEGNLMREQSPKDGPLHYTSPIYKNGSGKSWRMQDIYVIPVLIRHAGSFHHVKLTLIDPHT